MRMTPPRNAESTSKGTQARATAIPVRTSIWVLAVRNTSRNLTGRVTDGRRELPVSNCDGNFTANYGPVFADTTGVDLGCQLKQAEHCGCVGSPGAAEPISYATTGTVCH